MARVSGGWWEWAVALCLNPVTMANYRTQATVWAVTARATNARAAPAHPAPDAER